MLGVSGDRSEEISCPYNLGYDINGNNMTVSDYNPNLPLWLRH